MKPLFVSLLLTSALAAAPALAGAPGPAEMGDPAAGRQVAEDNCSACHAIGPAGDSPVAHAPRFRELEERWPLESLYEALAEGMVVGHSEPQMPAFRFLPEDIDDLIAYIDSLNP
jgi:mono/diheme cytochrome c family protein